MGESCRAHILSRLCVLPQTAHLHPSLHLRRISNSRERCCKKLESNNQYIELSLPHNIQYRSTGRRKPETLSLIFTNGPSQFGYSESPGKTVQIVLNSDLAAAACWGQKQVWRAVHLYKEAGRGNQIGVWAGQKIVAIATIVDAVCCCCAGVRYRPTYRVRTGVVAPKYHTCHGPLEHGGLVTSLVTTIWHLLVKISAPI